jgi:type VI secretion system protein ImpC
MDETSGMPEPETPFRVCILGDFSGRVNRGIFETGSALASRRLLVVDRDNFDDVLAKLGVEIHLPIAGNDSPPVTIRFTELDDFHPDRIFEHLEVFQALKETRKKLEDPRTFESAAQPAPPVPEISVTSSSLLDQVLDETEGRPPETGTLTDSSEWNAFLQRIVKPHLVPDVDPQQAELVAAVDAAIAKLMRTILHHPDFQAIEAAWRGLYFLVSRLETGAELKLYLLDISKAELSADLGATENLRSTATYRLLVEQSVETPGAEPWAVLVGNYIFDETREHVKLLGRMAKIASHAGAPFISAANAHLLGCDSLAETPDPDNWQRPTDTEESQAWEALRKLPEASYLGLALPGFLLRLPYGAETDPIEQFDFEEMTDVPHHDHYLWGNPSFACVCLLAQAFTHYGWNLRPGVIHDIEGLPLHLYKEEGESKVKACAEVVLTERAAEIIMENGLMPLLSFRNQDTIRLARFQSLADPLTPLAGRWG